MNLDAKPLFIIGNPRSGTTLLRLLLNSHPNICIPPESHFFLWLEKKYGAWTLDDSLVDFLNDLYASTKFETWDIDKTKLEELLFSNTPRNYSELIKIIYLTYCQKNIKYFGDKNKLWKEKLNDILKYFPEAKFIHIIRDGRDVACSYKELSKREYTSKYAPKLPSDIIEIANKWQENIAFIDEFLSNLPEEQYLTIHYENLLLSKDKESKRILDFLDLFYPTNGLDHLRIPTDHKEPKEFLEWKEKTSNPIRTDNIGKFRIELSKSEVQKFNEIAFSSLVNHGYL